MRIVDLATRIAPLGDRVNELPLFDCTFGELREREVAASGVAPARLTFADSAFASAPLLAEFARVAPGGKTTALALPDDAPSRLLAPVSSVRKDDGLLIYDVFLDADDDVPLSTLRRHAEPVKVDVESTTYRRHLPRIGPPPYSIE